MSLVSEALKKAEREAAARAARERGQPPPLDTPFQPYRAQRRTPPGRGRAAFWLLAGAATAAIVLAVVLARGTSERKSSNTRSPVPNAAPPIPAPSASEPTPPRPSTHSPRSTVDQRTTPPSELEVANAGAPPPSPQTAPSERPAPPSASEPAKPADGKRPATPPPAPRTGAEFVRRVEFPDGSRLELGGIAYSETAPFAYLNGKLLKVGEETAGFTLTRIERDRVVVQSGAESIVLRLHKP